MSNPIQNNKIFEFAKQQGVLSQKTPNLNPPLEENSHFESLLREQIHAPLHGPSTEKFGIKLSKHAKERLGERDIHLEDDDWKTIDEGLKQVASKGSRESLFLMDNFALVMGVPNRTVITVAGLDQLKNKVFTNIDSTIILTKNNDLEEKPTRLDLSGDLNQSGLHPLLSSKITTQTTQGEQNI